jgi:hypothetical protein
VTGSPPAAPRVDEVELRLLADQLDRMRAMLFGYSERFFERIRTWTLVALTLLVIGASGLAPVAFVPIPFLVPFAFLETGYQFFYTVFSGGRSSPPTASRRPTSTRPNGRRSPRSASAIRWA